MSGSVLLRYRWEALECPRGPTSQRARSRLLQRLQRFSQLVVAGGGLLQLVRALPLRRVPALRLLLQLLHAALRRRAPVLRLLGALPLRGRQALRGRQSGAGRAA